jgi:hypothetical protein
MAQKKKPRSSGSIGKTILNLIILIPTFYKLVGKVLCLVSYEAQLAGKTIIKLLLLAIASAVILASTWLCLLALIAVYLISLGISNILTITIIILLNILILILLMFIAHKSEKNLSFRTTRHQIRHALKNFIEE